MESHSIDNRGLIFADRAQAGRMLAERLSAYARRPETLVLALPRGGLPIGYAIAEALQVPLDVFIVRKLGVPGYEELAMGAIAEDGVRVFNKSVIRSARISKDEVERVIASESAELERRRQLYRGQRALPDLKNLTVILVDDGLATGASMAAAALAIREHDPARLVIAVPVGVAEVCEQLGAYADELICLSMPEPFLGVGHWYDDFSQTSDRTVRELLKLAQRWSTPPAAS